MYGWKGASNEFIRVVEGVEDRIPKRATRGEINEWAKETVPAIRECVIVGEWRCVIGVSASRYVHVWTHPRGIFLQCGPTESLAIGVLGEPHLGWRWRTSGCVEADGGVFPVPDMVAKLEFWVAKQKVATVESEEREVEDIGDVGEFRDDNDCGCCGRAD